MLLLAEWFVFWGVMNGVSEGSCQDVRNGTNVSSQLVNFFFCLYIYSLCEYDLFFSVFSTRNECHNWARASVFPLVGVEFLWYY